MAFHFFDGPGLLVTFTLQSLVEARERPLGDLFMIVHVMMPVHYSNFGYAD